MDRVGENKTVGMSYSKLGRWVGWLGGWVGGLT